ncbi:MAG: substrate-binding domain-containing protein [Terrimicrobiaceae bacterium]
MEPPSREKKKTKSVLLALSWYVHEINVGVARFAREAHWILDDAGSHAGKVPPGWSGNGVITMTNSRISPLAKLFKGLRMPVVNLVNEDSNNGFVEVLHDNVAIGRIAAEELLGKGFTDFAFFFLNRKAQVVRERMAGFRGAVLAAGGRFHPIDFTEESLKPHPEKRMIPWLAGELKKLPKPLGAMAQHDGEAIHIVRACELAGLVVPDEVAVVGVDNDPIYSELGPIPLTSVLSNRELLGYRAAEVLDGLMRGGKRPSQPIRIAPGGVVVRRSTDVFAAEDSCVARALAYIRANLSEPLDIQDIVLASGASRRALYMKFETYVRRSIGSEITRLRLNRAKSLLSTTDLKLEGVASESGFAGAAALSKAFRTHEGLAPSAYRQKHPEQTPKHST